MAKMTWEERRETHLKLWEEHFGKAMKALAQFNETRDYRFFNEYIAEYKESQKHYGIASAMFTRKFGKI